MAPAAAASDRCWPTGSAVEFIERVMPRDVAAGLSAPLAEARRTKQHPGRSLGRLLRQHSGGSDALPAGQSGGTAGEDDDVRRQSESEILYRADEGAVVLGRAGAIVLRDVPHALHVRLTGPRDLRIEHAMIVEDVDRETARWRQAEGDLARDTYVRHFYGVDPDDAALYHMVLDSTRLSLEACVEGIATAALELAGATPA